MRWRADRHRSPTAIAKRTFPQVSGTSHEGDRTMNETQLTITGNLVDDPELRFTPSGQPVAKFRIASTPRFYDKATNAWTDGDSLFLTVTCGARPPRTSPRA